MRTQLRGRLKYYPLKNQIEEVNESIKLTQRLQLKQENSQNKTDNLIKLTKKTKTIPLLQEKRNTPPTIISDKEEKAAYI